MSEKTIWKIFWGIVSLVLLFGFTSIAILIPVIITLLIIGSGL